MIWRPIWLPIAWAALFAMAPKIFAVRLRFRGLSPAAWRFRLSGLRLFRPLLQFFVRGFAVDRLFVMPEQHE